MLSLQTFFYHYNVIILPNGKFIRWNNNGQSYIGDNNNNLSQFANYAEISTINNKINQITGDMQLLTSRVEPYQSNLSTYTLTLPQNVFAYSWIYLHFTDTKVYHNYPQITPFGTMTSISDTAHDMLVHLLNPNLIMAVQTYQKGYDDLETYGWITFHPTNTNIVTFQGYSCNLQIYGRLA